MRRYPLNSRPARFFAEELGGDELCVRVPETLEQVLELFHLAGDYIVQAERRSRYLGQTCAARDEVVLHLREYVLHLQGEKLNLPHLTPIFARAS